MSLPIVLTMVPLPTMERRRLRTLQSRRPLAVLGQSTVHMRLWLMFLLMVMTTTMSGWTHSENWVSKPMRYVNEDDRDPTPDERNARWAANRIRAYAENGGDEPLFLAVGFIRPHTPLHVPQKYFDQFPIESVELPTIKDNDAADTHFKDLYVDTVKGLKYFRLLEESYPEEGEGIRAFTQAYLASVAAVDDCIGEVVDAVDNSSLKDNTIIVLISDHGWSMGQKDYLFKNFLWEESARVPFIVRAPGITQAGGVAEHPVSLIDLYPTLVDLCELRGDTRKNEKGASLDGYSLRPFLENPQSMEWDGPEGALTMLFAGEHSKSKPAKEDNKNPDKQHWSLRTSGWRYILYNNGLEELYDHTNDPHEWSNLAGNSQYSEIKDKLRQQLLAQADLNIE